MVYGLVGYGGEYKLGSVNNERDFELLEELNDNGDLSTSNEVETEEGETVSIEFFEYENVVANYGVAYQNGKLVSDESEDEIPLDTFNYVVLSNPSIEAFLESDKVGDEEIYGFFGGFVSEKGTFGTITLDMDNYDPKNMVIGVVNMDETFSEDLVVTKIYYFDESVLEKVNELSGFESYSYEEFLDEIQEVFDALNYDYSIFESYEIEIDMDDMSTISKSADAYLYDSEGEQLS